MILHIMTLEKFTPPFIDFIDKYFDISKHKFTFITSKKYQYGLTENHVVEFLHSDEDFSILKDYMKKSDKIILHGLWRDKVDAILFESPQLLKKCYWIMWGGDFYYPDRTSNVRKFVIKNVGYLVSYAQGDFYLAKKLYGATGQFRKCFSYPSNLYQELPETPTQNNTINILVGNSADPSNNHQQIFEKLIAWKDDNIKIFCPLSYGDNNYATATIKSGQNLFQHKFNALTKFIPKDNYLTLLQQMDIAVFNHERQQAMGNIITLLGLGKKIYMRPNISTYQMLKSLGATVYNTANIGLFPVKRQHEKHNQKIIKQYFSTENLIAQWEKIFQECLPPLTHRPHIFLNK